MQYGMFCSIGCIVLKSWILPREGGCEQHSSGSMSIVSIVLLFIACLAASFLQPCCVFLSVCLFVCLSVCLFVCLSVCLFVCLFVGLFVCSFVRSFACLFACLFVCLFVFVFLFVFVPVRNIGV